MNPIEQLQSVLCDPAGKCCITGSDEDRAIVDRALQALAAPQPLTREQLADAWISTAHITHATERQIAYGRAVEALTSKGPAA